jgi:hypothetical protein
MSGYKIGYRLGFIQPELPLYPCNDLGPSKLFFGGAQVP